MPRRQYLTWPTTQWRGAELFTAHAGEATRNGGLRGSPQGHNVKATVLPEGDGHPVVMRHSDSSPSLNTQSLSATRSSWSPDTFDIAADVRRRTSQPRSSISVILRLRGWHR